MKSRLLAAALVLTGCGVPIAESDPQVSNRCDDDTPCSADGVCVAGTCVSTRADLGPLYLQLDIPATASYAGGYSVVVDHTRTKALQGRKGAGFLERVDLFPELATVTATLELESVPAGCEALGADEKAPKLAHALELYPSLQVAGIPIAPFSATSTMDLPTASRQVPFGTYDIYVRPVLPERDELQSCRIPPILVRDYPVQKESLAVSLSAAIPATLTGTIDVALPGAASDESSCTTLADCWTVALLDNDEGRTLSTSEPLAPGATTFNLQAWPEVFDSAEFDPVLRLTPPASEQQRGMPEFFWKLSAIDLDHDLHVELSIAPFTAAEPKQVSGAVVTPEGSPLASVVTIQSTKLLDGTSGAIASYRTVLDTDANGELTAVLLPGEYRVLAVPPAASGLAATKTTWTITPNDLGEGRSLELRPRSALTGVATLPGGSPATGIGALLEPALNRATTFLQNQLDVAHSPVASPEASSVTDLSGGFEVQVDPGLFDLWLRPPARSGFPWLVRPQVGVPETSPQTADLGSLSIGYPVLLEGFVATTAGHPLAGVSLRAWIATAEPDPDARPVVVLVGEASTDARGRYRLLLPASLAE